MRRLGLDVDDDSERAPEAILEHDEAVFPRSSETPVLHELLAVKRPAFVKNRRLVHQPRQRARRGNGIGDRELQVMAR
jgi:hypothetical protein